MEPVLLLREKSNPFFEIKVENFLWKGPSVFNPKPHESGWREIRCSLTSPKTMEG
jgi:hypothetical protein